ncbi:sensor histidine kinase [Tenacibaculum xiamenense]|uniref:sensor histidine kinase n=1 Tax=Tenacibaculum xiamenense TaxID=1261553 RepID=UPI00389557EB
MMGRNFKYVILLIGLSSLGIIFSQINWLNNSFTLTQKNFNESVVKSLTEVKEVIKTQNKKNSIVIDENFKADYDYLSEDEKYRFKLYSISRFGSRPKFDQDFYNSLEEFQEAFLRRRNTDGSFKESVSIIYGQENIQGFNYYKEIDFDSLIKKVFTSNGVKLTYSFGIKNTKSNKWECIWGKELKDTSLLEKSDYVLEVFDNKSIYVVFYDKESYLYKSLFFNVLLSTIMVLIILFSLWFSLRIILKQKKLSQIKTDFINNMTHEFKTPIASIGTAAVAIEEPEIIGDESVVRQFTKVIKEENERMNKQVEMILKLAQNNHFITELEMQSVDVLKLAKQVVSQNRIRVDKKNGTIECIVKVDNTVVIGDEMYLHQAISNLVDNAIKYSPNEIHIKIEIEKKNEYLVIHVLDKGMGIQKDDAKRVFEKFYRVSTNNIHNVKGFGLGLSYVKQIADAHNGHVTLKSSKKGSVFSLFLPQKKE